jgi:hypothetical protein
MEDCIMKLYKEGLRDFEPWSGAVPVWDAIVDAGKVDILESVLDDLYQDGLISETQLNDLLWFDGDEVLSWLGIK